MTCTHPRIITYHDADTGQPVRLWACAECGHRFEPMQLDETALLRQALEALEYASDCLPPSINKQIAETIVALRERLGGDRLSPTANLTRGS